MYLPVKIYFHKRLIPACVNTLFSLTFGSWRLGWTGRQQKYKMVASEKLFCSSGWKPCDSFWWNIWFGKLGIIGISACN